MKTTTPPSVEVVQVTVGPLQENCWIVADNVTREAVVIDPGYEGARIRSAIEDIGVRPTAIWLTHAHADHVGAVRQLVDELGLRVLLHPADLPLYQRAADTGRLYGMHFLQPELPDEDLNDGDAVQCGTLVFRVVHVPGHSPGQVAFIGPGVCFAGDLLFRGSIGRTDLPLSDPRAMRTSLERIALLDDDVVVYPGHGDVTTIGHEKSTNPFLSGLARPIRS